MAFIGYIEYCFFQITAEAVKDLGSLAQPCAPRRISLSEYNALSSGSFRYYMYVGSNIKLSYLKIVDVTPDF